MVHEEHWRSLLHTVNPSLIELHKYRPVSFFWGVIFVLTQHISGDMPKHFKLQRHDKGPDDNTH